MVDLKKGWAKELVNIVAGSLLVLLVLFGYDVFTGYRKAHRPAVPQRDEIKTGASVSLEGADFTQSPVSLVMVSSPDCKYCRASENFHSKLIAMARTGGVPVFVAVPSLKEASSYLAGLNVDSKSAREYHQLNLAVSGTPTIFAVDNTGHVKALWIGLATPADESEIVSLVQNRSFGSLKASTRIDAPNFQPQELERIKLKTNLNVIDIRERNKYKKSEESINIPLVELPYRADRELDKKKLQLVDCSNVLWDECKVAVGTLKKLQFNTATLAAGTYHLRCKATPLG
jgi:hypothetical protein